MENQYASGATWDWDVNTARLTTYLPPRNTHDQLLIQAEIAEYDTFGSWKVVINGRIMAEGIVQKANSKWVGRSPQLRAEDVIIRGATLNVHKLEAVR